MLCFIHQYYICDRLHDTTLCRSHIMFVGECSCQTCTLEEPVVGASWYLPIAFSRWHLCYVVAYLCSKLMIFEVGFIQNSYMMAHTVLITWGGDYITGMDFMYSCCLQEALLKSICGSVIGVIYVPSLQSSFICSTPTPTPGFSQTALFI